MKTKYEKPTGLDLGDILLKAHGSCVTGGLAGDKECTVGGRYSENPNHCKTGSVAFEGPGACKAGNVAEDKCEAGSSPFTTL